MKIKDSCLDEMTLREFMEKYDLVLKIHERTGWYNPNLGENGRFYCTIEKGVLLEGNALFAMIGDGATKQEAVDNYTKIISGKYLVVNASYKNRKEIQVPHLTESGISI